MRNLDVFANFGIPRAEAQQDAGAGIPANEKGPGGGRVLPVKGMEHHRGVAVGERRRIPNGGELTVEAFLAEPGWSVTHARCRNGYNEIRVVDMGRLASYEHTGGAKAPRVPPMGDLVNGSWTDLDSVTADELLEAGYPVDQTVGLRPGSHFARVYKNLQTVGERSHGGLILLYKFPGSKGLRAFTMVSVAGGFWSVLSANSSSLSEIKERVDRLAARA